MGNTTHNSTLLTALHCNGTPPEDVFFVHSGEEAAHFLLRSRWQKSSADDFDFLLRLSDDRLPPTAAHIWLR